MQLPQIDTPLLLDLLFGVVILLFVPFGIRRGAAKEVVVSAGILLASTIATAWAEPWSAELMRRFGLDPVLARFGVTVAILLAGALLLGYGGGAALGRVPAGIPGRLVGGLLAAVNAALLLALLLAAVERDLRPGAPLGASVIGGTLLRDFDRLLLAAGGLALLCVVLGWIVNAIRAGRAPREPLNPAFAGVPPRQRPVRLARDADAGKFEPEFGTGSVPLHAPLNQTVPLPPRPDEQLGGAVAGSQPWWRPASPVNGNHGAPAASPDWARRPAAEQSFGRPADVGLSGGDGGRRFGGTGPFDAAGGRGRCPTCGATVAPSDFFCPSCGKTL